MDIELKTWLSDKFDDQAKQIDALERHAKEQLAGHIEADRLVHQQVLDIMHDHKLTLYGNKTEAMPGLVKEMDRLQNGIVTLRWLGGAIGGTIGSIATWAASKLLLK